jgi:hypothetical protein
MYPISWSVDFVTAHIFAACDKNSIIILNNLTYIYNFNGDSNCASENYRCLHLAALFLVIFNFLQVQGEWLEKKFNYTRKSQERVTNSWVMFSLHKRQEV